MLVFRIILSYFCRNCSFNLKVYLKYYIGGVKTFIEKINLVKLGFIDSAIWRKKFLLGTFVNSIQISIPQLFQWSKFHWEAIIVQFSQEKLSWEMGNVRKSGSAFRNFEYFTYNNFQKERSGNIFVRFLQGNSVGKLCDSNMDKLKLLNSVITDHIYSENNNKYKLGILRLITNKIICVFFVRSSR